MTDQPSTHDDVLAEYGLTRDVLPDAFRDRIDSGDWNPESLRTALEQMSATIAAAPTVDEGAAQAADLVSTLPGGTLATSNPAGLPYEVTLVEHATDTAPEKRTVIAAFLEPELADSFTDQLVVRPGTHYETPGLAPAEFRGLPPGTLPTPGTPAE